MGGPNPTLALDFQATLGYLLASDDAEIDLERPIAGGDLRALQALAGTHQLNFRSGRFSPGLVLLKELADQGLDLPAGDGSDHPCRHPVVPIQDSLGLGFPFLLAAASADRAMAAFDWPRRHAAAVMRLGGLMLVLVGVLQVSGAWGALIARMQGTISGFQPLL